MLDGNEF